jgi:anti-anti-sigma factor
MLMITVENEAAGVTLRLDGRLAGAEARELARYRSSAAFDEVPQAVALDLTGVSWVDGEGRDFLAQAHLRGDRLVEGVATRAIVAEITALRGPAGSRERSTMTALDASTNASVLEVEGDLRAPVSMELRERVAALLDRGERRIVLDLARIADIDAAGIGELVHVVNAATAAGAMLRIAHATGPVRRLLDTSGLSGLFSDGEDTLECPPRRPKPWAVTSRRSRPGIR